MAIQSIRSKEVESLNSEELQGESKASSSGDYTESSLYVQPKDSSPPSNPTPKRRTSKMKATANKMPTTSSPTPRAFTIMGKEVMYIFFALHDFHLSFLALVFLWCICRRFDTSLRCVLQVC